MPSRSIAATLLALVAIAHPVHAQRAVSSGYTGFFSAGTSWIATSDLNERMASSGHSGFCGQPFGISLAAYRLMRGSLMLGGEWHYVSFGSSSEPDGGVQLGGGAATLGVAYAIDMTPRVRVYPRVGIGVAGMGLWTEEPDTAPRAPTTFGDWLSNPQYDASQSTLSQASMAVDVGAGAEWLVRRARGGPLVGVRAGYLATPFDQGWTLRGQAVGGAPRTSMAGPYVRMIVGWRREQ